MAAYVIADIEMTDAARYEEYRRRVPATVAQYGGRFLVRGGAHRDPGGRLAAARLVVIEFPSIGPGATRGTTRRSTGSLRRSAIAAPEGERRSSSRA